MAPSRTSGHLSVGARFDPREASAATRERRARAFSSPSSMLSTAFAILALARVVDAEVVLGGGDEWNFQPWGENKPTALHVRDVNEVEESKFLPEHVWDDDVEVRDFADDDPGTWSMYYSGKLRDPWFQLDLGSARSISAIQIYGHRAAEFCDLNLVGKFPEGCTGYNRNGNVRLTEIDGQYFTPAATTAFKLKETIVGVGLVGVPPCTETPVANQEPCAGGIVCGVIDSYEKAGFTVNVDGSVDKQVTPSITITWYAALFAGLVLHDHIAPPTDASPSPLSLTTFSKPAQHERSIRLHLPS